MPVESDGEVITIWSEVVTLRSPDFRRAFCVREFRPSLHPTFLHGAQRRAVLFTVVAVKPGKSVAHINIQSSLCAPGSHEAQVERERFNFVHREGRAVVISVFVSFFAAEIHYIVGITIETEGNRGAGNIGVARIKRYPEIHPVHDVVLPAAAGKGCGRRDGHDICDNLSHRQSGFWTRASFTASSLLGMGKYSLRLVILEQKIL